MRYRFCPKCGGTLEIQGTKSIHQPKCINCGFIFYQNPIVGVAAIVIQDQKLLLGKRNISYKDKWCIPCGYVEYDEDVRAAAKREFFEETGLHIELKKVYEVHSNFHNPEQHTVGIWFFAEVLGGTLKANDDLSEVDYFAFDAIPELAFETDLLVIEKLKAEKLL
ncbi:NUDIX domain-containing protein [Alkalihalobacterium chitinilyticum]|uniref:NUDIX domain-containing protein n=1 Tax=Alkalihalobacterium chitinilyticum TaxID=2980103 RepID=A0ABT5VG33_9BACI|nr:NUDIX domain-containing protein [Alkalihalobacterium chitinilyticum]MDE5414416.1 NUDIX domain-containing protein [Alkalihalobacterium chitinilyticum]